MRSPSPASSRSVSGRSRTIPRSSGRLWINSTSRAPLPPPTSTTTSPSRHSRAASCSEARSRSPAIAASKVARSAGCSASHSQKPVPNRPGNGASDVDASRSVVASKKTPPKRFANSLQPGPRRSREGSVCSNTPGSVSRKTPSLASARRRRCSVSGLPPSSETGRGPSARASGTPASTTAASAFVISAPRRKSQSSLIRGRARPQ